MIERTTAKSSDMPAVFADITELGPKSGRSSRLIQAGHDKLIEKPTMIVITCLESYTHKQAWLWFDKNCSALVLLDLRIGPTLRRTREKKL